MEIKKLPDNFENGIIGISIDIMPGWTFDTLKRELLLFDAIGMLSLNTMVESYEEFPENVKAELATIEYLLDEDVIFDAHPAAYFPKYEEVERFLEGVKDVDYKPLWHDKFSRKDDINWKALELTCSAMYHQLNDDLPAIPVIEPERYPGQQAQAKGNAAHVVINAFPHLDESQLSFQDVLQLRREPELVQSRLALRRWMKKLDSDGLNKYEVKDELEFLLAEYTTYMELMKLKYHLGGLQGLIQVSLGAIENLMKFKLTELSDGLFDVGKRRVALLEDEMDAPGKELAYIHMLRNKLNR